MESEADQELRAVAEREILAETRRAAVRAEVRGPQGWRRPQLGQVNKRFLQNTLVSSLVQDKSRDPAAAAARLRAAPALQPSREQEERGRTDGATNVSAPKTTGGTNKVGGKIKITNKSRYNAYLSSMKRDKNRVNDDPIKSESEASEHSSNGQSSEKSEHNTRPTEENL